MKKEEEEEEIHIMKTKSNPIIALTSQLRILLIRIASGMNGVETIKNVQINAKLSMRVKQVHA